MAEPYYTTADLLRTAVGVDDSVLDDAAAVDTIEDAEDLIDELLGFWIVDELTGRKIDEADIEDWRWSKLQRATTKLAAALYRDPTLATRMRYDSEKGPDFAVSGAIGGAIATDVLVPLNASGLRRLGSHATRGGLMRGGRFAKFFLRERG